MKIGDFPNELDMNKFEIKEFKEGDKTYNLKFYGPPYSKGLGIEIYEKGDDIPKAVIRLDSGRLEVRTKNNLEIFDLKK